MNPEEIRTAWFRLVLFGPCVGRISTHNPKGAGSNPAPATIDDEGLADAAAANPFRLPSLHPGIGSFYTALIPFELCKQTLRPIDSAPQRYRHTLILVSRAVKVRG